MTLIGLHHHSFAMIAVAGRALNATPWVDALLIGDGGGGDGCCAGWALSNYTSGMKIKTELITVNGEHCFGYV